MEVAAGRQQKWEKGLVFVRSWESQLAKRGESLLVTDAYVGQQQRLSNAN